MKRYLPKGLPPGGFLLLLGLSVCFLYFFVYFPTLNNPNENVRLYMTSAMVEDGSMAIGRRDYPGKVRPGAPMPGDRKKRLDHSGPVERWGYVNDKALVCDSPEEEPPHCAGDLYSAKAPGASFLGVPVYVAVKSLKGPEVTKHDYVFWLRLLCVVLPTIVFFWFFYLFLGRYAPSHAIRAIVIVGYGLGSMVFTYSQMFAGHQLTSLSLMSAFMALVYARENTDASRKGWMALSGFFLSLAVAFEYPTVFPALVLVGFWIASRPRWKDVLAFGIGGLPGVWMVTGFHHVAFGAFYRTPYITLENPGFVRDIAPGFMGLQFPTLEAFWGSFFVPYNGMFFFAPWLALVGVAAVWWIVDRIRHRPAPTHQRTEIGVALLVVAILTLFISSHSLWRGGWTIGPRYIVAFVPFAVLAIAATAQVLFQRWPQATMITLGGAVVASVFITLSCSMVSQGFPFEYENPFVEAALPLLRDGYVGQNMGNAVGLHGLWSAAPFLILVGTLLLTCLYGALKGQTRHIRCTAAATSLAVGTLIVVLLSLWTPPWNTGKAEKDRWLREVWEPVEQSPEMRQRAQLEGLVKERETLDPAQWMQLGNLRAMDGQSASALRAYRKARGE